MPEKRKFPRYNCKVKTKFEFYEGNPDDFDAQKSKFKKGKGLILDISNGGIFIVTDEKVSIGLPIKASFGLEKEKYSINGTIVRTGLLKNNPSELAKKFAEASTNKDAYIAMEFNEPVDFPLEPL